MRVRNIEIAITKMYEPRKLKDFFELSYLKTMCGCRILSVSVFYLTLLSKTCHTGDFNE